MVSGMTRGGAVLAVLGALIAAAPAGAEPAPPAPAVPAPAVPAGPSIAPVAVVDPGPDAARR